MRTAAWTDSVSVLDRLSAVLDAFGDDEGLGVTELALRANLPKSTVSRIATDLVSEGYLERVDGTLHLGIRLFELGQSVEEPRRLRRLAMSTLLRTRDSTGHNVHLAISDGDEVVIIASANGSDSRQHAARVGERLGLTTTALGTAFGAFARSEDPGAAVVAYEALHGDHVCIASPVFERRSIVAAVSISGMIDVVDPITAAPLVRQAAMAISQRMIAR